MWRDMLVERAEQHARAGTNATGGDASGGPVGDAPKATPGPGVVLLAAGLAGVALLVRRRRA